MILKVKEQKRFGKMCLNVVFDRSNFEAYYCPRNPLQYSVAETALCPPRMLSPLGLKEGRLVLTVSSNREALHTYWAKKGFSVLSKDSARQMFDHCEIPYEKGAKPISKNDIVHSMCKFWLGDNYSEHKSDIELYLKGEHPADELPADHDGFIDTDVWKHCDFEDEDFDENIAFYEKYLQAELEMKKRRDQKPKIKPVVVAPTITPPVGPRLVTLPAAGWNIYEASPYCPPDFKAVKGVTRDVYWQVRHKKGKPSFSRRFSNSDATSSNNAIVTCLRLAWVHHIGDGPEECPFKFEVP